MGVLAGTSDPSEIGTSAASVTKVLNLGRSRNVRSSPFLPFYLCKAGLSSDAPFDSGAQGRPLSIGKTPGMHMP